MAIALGVAASVIKVAKGEVGYHEGFSGGHWNNIEKFAPQVSGLEWAQGQAWCDVFVAYCALKGGAAALYPRSASCDTSWDWFVARKQTSEYPAVGAQVFFGTAADKSHTGLVYDYDDTYVYTVEGNTNTSGSREGDGVYLKRHLRTDPRVVGYGYPKFPEGIRSADPKYKNSAPAKVTTAKAATGAAAAAAVVLASTASPAPAPAKPVAPAVVKPVVKPEVKPVVKPKPKPTSVFTYNGDCKIVVTKGKIKATGTCTTQVKKGK